MNKTTLISALVLVPWLAPSVYAQSELDLAVSADDVELEYSHRNEELGRQWSAGALYNDAENATMLSAGFSVVGEATANGQVFTGLGVKAAAHETFQTAGSLALGGFVEFQPAELQGLGLEGQLYYAPEVLNTNDADQFYELEARVTYAVHPQAEVFVSWSNVVVGYDHELVDEVNIEDGFNLGFTLML